jgi:hypothetical protein
MGCSAAEELFGLHQAAAAAMAATPLSQSTGEQVAGGDITLWKSVRRNTGGISVKKRLRAAFFSAALLLGAAPPAAQDASQNNPTLLAQSRGRGRRIGAGAVGGAAVGGIVGGRRGALIGGGLGPARELCTTVGKGATGGADQAVLPFCGRAA